MIDPITLLRAKEAGLPAAESHPDPPLVCFPMPSEWRALNPAPERTPWPTPERVATEVDPFLAKVSLLELARSFGWKYRITEARGCFPSVGGRPSRQRDSIAYRFWRGGDRAVAVYVAPVSEATKTWTWDTLLTWTLDTFPHGHATLEQFTAAITGPVQAVKWPSKDDWRCPYFGPLHGPERPKRVRSEPT